MSDFKKILLIGATGSIGSFVRARMETQSSFTITLLQRFSSKAKLPSHIRTITITDTYPTEELVQALANQDVIVNCMMPLSVADQFRMIDATIIAGVRRYVPSEYGLNNMRPDAQAFNVVFRDKGEVQEYLRFKANQGVLEWMSISCGMWMKWSVAHEFLWMHVKDRRFVIWDDGGGLMSFTTEENTATGLVRALQAPSETKNINVLLSDFAASQKQILEAIERIQGVKYTTETVDSRALIEEKQSAVRDGDASATFSLIETGFVTGRYGGHLEKEGVVMNEKLGLPSKSLDEAVTAALKSVGAI